VELGDLRNRHIHLPVAGGTLNDGAGGRDVNFQLLLAMRAFESEIHTRSRFEVYERVYSESFECPVKRKHVSRRGADSPPADEKSGGSLTGGILSKVHEVATAGTVLGVLPIPSGA
jgi:hypothetical protein